MSSIRLPRFYAILFACALLTLLAYQPQRRLGRAAGLPT